jgi:hypothetical protein
MCGDAHWCNLIFKALLAEHDENEIREPFKASE